MSVLYNIIKIFFVFYGWVKSLVSPVKDTIVRIFRNLLIRTDKIVTAIGVTVKDKIDSTCIFVKNGPNVAGLGYGGEGFTTMSIAGTTGEGITKASTFTRPRRCTLVDYFRII